jgi:4-aminobutyrate aminotransferase / (S)-3-amino-2-methylpropionate transaminase / 5-aminovalerate transaminase
MSKSIQLKTTVPGPKSRALLERRQINVPRGVYNATPIFVDHADGALVHDVDGNTFIDFSGGIGTINVGHANPAVVDAASRQMQRFTHTCFSVAMYESYITLAEKLNQITPGNFSKKTMLVNSGAEAVENAVKIARHSTGRNSVVVFEHAFHGRTLLTMSMTSKVKPYKFGFGPFAPEIYRLPFPYSYRQDVHQQIEDLQDFFTSHVAVENIACIVFELVVGEGGFVVAPVEYVQTLQELCRKNNILLVVDEIQTGFCRTGKMFACEHYNLEPDLIVLAKSMAGGLPLSSVTGRSEIMESAQIGGLGGTFSGNPVSCAAAVAAIDFMQSHDLAERAASIGNTVRARFDGLQKKHPEVGEVRGLGAMMALEIVKDRATREPDQEKVQSITKQCYENGLILLSAGTYGNCIRTLMPLVITEEQLNEGLDVIDHAF